ncbi:hypothetical protein EL22_28795 [Halostagnicola sp. A56]|nr:hypothetical protein EL22_28795 [Halostagnicola sp. A56]
MPPGYSWYCIPWCFISLCRKTGLQLAHEAVAAQIENPSIYDNFAAQIVEVDEQFGIESLDLDIGDSDVSELALEYAEKAVRQDSTEAEYYATLGRVYSLRGELDEAERNVQRAIELRLDEETQGQPNTASFRSILRTIKSKRQIQKIESQFEEAQEQLDEISEKHNTLEEQYESLDGKYNSIESKLEDAVEKYRTQTLQFIGFFTALLAVVVTSVQVTEITNSVSEARSLIITLIGGILVSFGGFSLMLPDKESGFGYMIIRIANDESIMEEYSNTMTRNILAILGYLVTVGIALNYLYQNFI